MSPNRWYPCLRHIHGASTLPHVQSTKTRINPHGSDGASALPNVQSNNGRPNQNATVFSEVAHHEKRFHLREGKAPPAPQLTNRRFNPYGSDVQSTKTRINPHGSDGASTLPHVQLTNTRIHPHGSDGASTLPDVQPFRTCGHPGRAINQRLGLLQHAAQPPWPIATLQDRS